MSTKTISFLTFVVLLVAGCQAPSSSAPTPISSSSTVILAEPYGFPVGLARIRHEFPAGVYRAAYRDDRGIYFRFETTRYGVYIAHDRKVAYLWTTEEGEVPIEKRTVQNIYGPGGALIAEILLPTPKLGSIVKLFRLPDGWQSSFVISEDESETAEPGATDNPGDAQ